ncbi:MAG: hypothetical protein ABJ308_06285 [Halieaceae bacterium]
MEGFNWQDLGAMGEMFGAFGVLASIVYFATVLRFNANVTRDATTYNLMQLAITFRSESYKGDLAEIRLKAATGAQLNDLELLKFEGYLSALFEMTELIFMAWSKKKIDDEYMEAWDKRIHAAMSMPRIKNFWARTKSGYRPSFANYVDALVENTA